MNLVEWHLHFSALWFCAYQSFHCWFRIEPTSCSCVWRRHQSNFLHTHLSHPSLCGCALRTTNDSRALPYCVYAHGLCPCVWYQYALAQMTRCEFTYQLSVAQHSIRKTFKVKLESYSVLLSFVWRCVMSNSAAHEENKRRKKRQNYFINTSSLQRNWSQQSRELREQRH